MIEKFSYISKSTSDSIRLGKKISAHLESGDVIGLNGDLGSGKTTFVKGILEGLNYEGDVTSPTFTLINEYYADMKVIHVDFYRDENIQRWKNLGFHEIINNNDIILIEWSNLIEQLLPSNVNIVNFEHVSENERKIYIK